MALTRPLGKGMIPVNQCCKAAAPGISVTPKQQRQDSQNVSRFRQALLHLTPTSELYQHASSHFPSVVPPNIDEINSASRVRFSPRRSRDISGRLALLGGGNWLSAALVDQQASVAPDTHVQSYDCRGTVSLHAAMQTNVPEPFCVDLTGHTAEDLLMPGGRPTHLNMPGGHLGQEDKYISRDLQDIHPRRLQGGSRR